MQPEELLQKAETILSGHTVFNGLLKSGETKYLLECGVLRSVTAGQIICQQHDRDSSLYIILLGEVEVSHGEKSNRITLARLGQGEIFGEISALFKIPRVSTVVARQPSVLLEIDGDAFESLMAENQLLLKAVIKRFAERITETALRNVSFLRYLPADTLSGLQQHASLICTQPGGLIVKEGEPGDAMYILVHGAARVTHELNGQSLNIALLGPGDYFGEWSVLTGAPRAATVVALSTLHAIYIDREQLLYFIQQHPDVRDRIDQVAHNRHEHTSGLEHQPESEQAISSSIQHIHSLLDQK